MLGLETCSRGQLKMCEQSSAKVSDARVESREKKKNLFLRVSRAPSLWKCWSLMKLHAIMLFY